MKLEEYKAVVVMSSGEHDAELIDRSLWDNEAFGALYDRHAPQLAAYLMRRVAPDHVEGLLSDVFVAAFEHRRKFDRSHASALPWLYGIARNLVRRHCRTHSRERVAIDRLAGLTRIDAMYSVDELPDGSSTTDVDRERLLAAIDRQPEIDREVLLLYAWEELGYVEIAEALDIPVGTVKSRLNRIRRKLRRVL